MTSIELVVGILDGAARGSVTSDNHRGFMAARYGEQQY